MSQAARYQETLRRLAMIDKGFIEDEAGPGRAQDLDPGTQNRGDASTNDIGGPATHARARNSRPGEWSEQLSPFVTVAKVRIPRQDISGDDNLEKMDALSFTPWRVTAEHCPLGNIMRARKEVYRRASVLRHTLNHQQRKEPGSADEVLP